MSSEDETPNGRRLRRQRLREITERTIARPPSIPPDWEDNEEPSVTRYIEGPDGRVSVEGFGPHVAEIVEAAKRAKHPSIYARVQESLAPISKKMETKGGKAAAIATGIVTVIGVLLEVLRQLGVFKAGP
jgi:hypothetical protein